MMKPFLTISDSPIIPPAEPCLMLVYVTKGHATATVDNHAILLQSGDVLMVSSRQIKCTILEESGASLFYVLLDKRKSEEILGPLLFSQNDLTRFLFQEPFGKTLQDYCVVSTRNDLLICRLFSELWDEYKQKKEFFDFALQHRFLLLMTELIRRHKTHVMQNVPSLLTEEGYELYNYITCSDFRVTLEDVAKRFYIAPSYASRYVKKLTGVSFSRLLKSCRFYVATLMLSTTNKSISAISEQVGYDNPENFIRAFKKEYKITPSQYRLENQ